MSVKMVGNNNKKPQLPKSVLDMKFMKKTKERIERELENTQNHEGLYSNIITNEMRQASGNYISEPSFVFCENLLEGRLSFKGMNPEIERLMELENKPEVTNSEMDKDVTDEVLYNKMESYKNRKRQFHNNSPDPSKYTLIKKKKK